MSGDPGAQPGEAGFPVIAKQGESALSLIAKLLVPANIFLDADLGGKRQLFEKIGLLLEQRHGLSHDFITRGLLRREKAGSTGLGQGVAIPHARFKGLEQTQAVYLRPRQPMPFNAPDRMPVTDILVLLVPEPASDQHLEILAEAARLFSDADFRARLRACTDATEVIRLFAA
jgi:PTS system nitrogen regulatory IIA component